MNNLPTNSTQAALRKEICRLLKYEVFPFVGATSVGIQQIVFAVINAVMALAAIFGNSLILAAVWKTPSLRSPSYVLISVLALSDLGVGIFIQPTYVITLSTRILALSRVHCISFKILGSSILPFAAVSFFAVTATSVERLLALRLHLRYRELVTNKRVLLVIALFCKAGIVCQIMRFLVKPVIFGSMIIFVALVGMGVNAWSYFKNFQIVKIHQAQIHAQVQISHSPSNQGTFPNMARYKKSVLTMLYIYGFFVLCYFPCSVVAIIAFMMDGSLFLLDDISLIVTFFNSSLNPVLFC